MFRTDIELFKTQQKELHRQAADFRLARSLMRDRRHAGDPRENALRALLSAVQNSMEKSQSVSEALRG